MQAFDKQALIEQILTRVADETGDITQPVMALYYRRLPGARQNFADHARGDLAQLEGEMVERTLYCLMTWFESPGEIEILLSGSVPHHQETLQVPPDYYAELIEATADIIEDHIPANQTAEREAWRELRLELRQIITNRAA